MRVERAMTIVNFLSFEVCGFQEYYCDNELIKRRLCSPPYMNLPYEISHIKTITITEFKGDYQEIQVANFVLQKAVSLESLILHPAEGLQISEKLHKELLQFPRASRTAEVKFSQALGEEDLCPRLCRLWQSFKNSS